MTQTEAFEAVLRIAAELTGQIMAKVNIALQPDATLLADPNIKTALLMQEQILNVQFNAIVGAYATAWAALAPGSTAPPAVTSGTVSGPTTAPPTATPAPATPIAPVLTGIQAALAMLGKAA